MLRAAHTDAIRSADGVSAAVFSVAVRDGAVALFASPSRRPDLALRVRLALSVVVLPVVLLPVGLLGLITTGCGPPF
jgi:hypothetical protein